MKSKEINWDEYPIGTKIKATIQDDKVEGRIMKENGNIYICQNTRNGSAPTDTLGYKYSWSLMNGSSSSLISVRVNINSIVLTLDKDFDHKKYEPLISIAGGWLKFGALNVVRVTNSPFSNCQNLSIANFQRLSYEEPKTLQKVFHRLSRIKAFTVIDIRKEYVDQLPKDESLFVFKTEYKSTNNSKMCIAGLKNAKMAKYYEKLSK